MSKGNELIKKVREFFEEARKLMPEVTDEMLCDEGDGEKIYYMNGNDGTHFDFSCNNRLCEFFMFYKSTEMGFVKVFVYKDGTMDGYVYREDYERGDKALRLSRKDLSRKDVLYFAALMKKIADNKLLWDKPISQLDFSAEVSEVNISDMQDEEQTVKEFLKGTKNNHIVIITEDSNDNEVFHGTYEELKKNRKDLLAEYVSSWDVVPMADGTVEIGIMI